MPPIPVYADIPLHPDGATPKTAAPEGELDPKQPNPAPTRTTAAPTSSSPYDPNAPPPPQPGARPLPPTAAASTSTYAPPPAPQPGSFPSVTATHTTTDTTTLPPPPQFTMPFPSTNYAPTHSTNADATAHYPHAAQFSPVEFGAGPGHEKRHSIEHPPGYQQNPYAVDGTAQDRARFERAEREAREEEGVMGSLRTWAGRAGSVAKELEEGAWKYLEKAGK